LANKEGISLNLFLSVVAEKMSALLTERYLEERATKGNIQSFAMEMSKVPDVEASNALIF
jgi:hypothetical protein